MACAARITDFSPDPHTLLTVKAGVACGRPAAMPIWRAMFCPNPDGKNAAHDQFVDLIRLNACAAQGLDDYGRAQLGPTKYRSAVPEKCLPRCGRRMQLRLHWCSCCLRFWKVESCLCPACACLECCFRAGHRLSPRAGKTWGLSGYRVGAGERAGHENHFCHCTLFPAPDELVAVLSGRLARLAQQGSGAPASGTTFRGRKLLSNILFTM